MDTALRSMRWLCINVSLLFETKFYLGDECGVFPGVFVLRIWISLAR